MRKDYIATAEPAGAPRAGWGRAGDAGAGLTKCKLCL